MENSSSSSSSTLSTPWENFSPAYGTPGVTVQGAGQEAGLSLPLQVFSCLAMSLVLLLALLGNAVVCVMVYRRAAMRSAINILLAGLAFTDAMLALLSMPFALVATLAGHWPFGDTFCRLSAVLFWLFLLEGAAVLLIIGVDRFLIIVRRQDRLSPRRAKLLMVASWALSLCLALPPALGLPALPAPPRAPQCVFGYSAEGGQRAYAVLMVLLCFFLPFLVMLYAFLGILSTIRRNALRVRSESDSVCPGQVGKLGLIGLRRPFRLNVDVSFKTRAFATVLMLFCAFAVCRAPFAAYSLVAVFSSSFYTSSGFFRVSAWLLWLCFLRSALNPLIYYWRIKKFRDACLHVLPKSCTGLLPRLPGHTRRRIRPSTVYACAEHRSIV